MKITLPRSSDPQVSLIVVSHGNVEITKAALEAIAATTPPIYETIVVESDSSEAAHAILERDVEGIELVRCENVGFGHSANVGAALAKAPVLCILNNDVSPHAGWLGCLLWQLDAPDVGAVVPMLLDPDGTLQEAGVAMGSDGFSWRWGLGRAADDPEVLVPRDVDYGSACVLFRAEVYAAAGGFRPEYGLGYLEDADLALTIADAGWRIVYEPAARLAHILHATFGSERAERLSAENRPKLLARWGEFLADRPRLQHAVLHPSQQVRARDALASHRILVLATTERGTEVAHAIRGVCPRAQITVGFVGSASVEMADPARDRHEHIESVPVRDPEGWLAGRRGHPDLVWVDDVAAFAATRHALAATQRQAPWVIRGQALDTDEGEWRPPRGSVIRLEDPSEAPVVPQHARREREGASTERVLAAAGIRP